MHFDTATRQRWMSVLAHSEPQELAARMQTLQLAPQYELIRAPETGLVQLQARMGGIGDRFFAGDATLTRAAIRLADGTLGYSWILGRDRAHAERCAAIDALMQSPHHFHTLMETLITPLEEQRSVRIEARRAEVNASRVDFFTLVRGDNALNQHRHQVSPYHHPQQLVAKAGAGLDVGGEVTRIDIADGSNERRPHQGELNLARCATAAILNATVCHFLPLEI